MPLADLTPPGPVIELFEAEPAPAPSPVEPPSQPVDEKTIDEKTIEHEEPVAKAEREEVILPAVVPRRPAAEPHVAESVIPLVHSPDDPGPDGELADEPAPVSPEPWWRRRFR